MSGTNVVGTAAAVVDASGESPQAPAWLRRGVFLVLVAIAGFQASMWLFQNLRGFLGLLFLAWLLAISVEPAVDALARRGVRRGPATALVLFGLATAAVGFVVVFGALLVDQLTELLGSLPGAVTDVVDWANRTFGTAFQAEVVSDSLRLTPERIEQLATQLTPGLVGIVSSLVTFVFQGFTLMLFAFYMSAQGPQLRRTVTSWFPPRRQPVIGTVWEIAVDKTGGYVISRLLLAALSALLTGAVLWLLGVPYWLPLAIWTGVVSQFIPTLGTYLAIAVPALIALSEQPMDALWVILFGVAYQQVENYVFAPRITARTVAIHPAVAFGSVIVGAALFGPVGALVSIPVVAAIQAVVETYGRRYELVDDGSTTEPVDAAEPSDSTSEGEVVDGPREAGFVI